MILDNDTLSDIGRAAEIIRTECGDKSLDILWNKVMNRWVVVQRIPGRGWPVSDLIRGCLPNPDAPEFMVDMQGLFIVQTNGGGYRNPASSPHGIARHINENCKRRDESEAAMKKNRERIEYQEASERADHLHDIRSDLMKGAKGRVTFSG